MKQLLYLIGQPGSGKSTLVRALTDGVASEAAAKPFAHILWGPTPIVELGARRDTFAGTDALGMSVQPLVQTWLQDTPHELVLAEGDRLANAKFFNAVLELGWDLAVVRLAVSSAVAQQRREARAAALGVPLQAAGWLAGRITKVRNLARLFEPLLIDLDADQPPADVLAQLVATGHPVVRLLTSPQ